MRLDIQANGQSVLAVEPENAISVWVEDAHTNHERSLESKVLFVVLSSRGSFSILGNGEIQLELGRKVIFRVQPVTEINAANSTVGMDLEAEDV